MKSVLILLILLIFNPIVVSAETLFESNDTVNRFLISYNEVADNKLKKSEIERGNIDTKALIYMEDYSFEIIYVDSLYYESFENEPVLTIDISAKFDADQEGYFELFKNTMIALGLNQSVEELRELFENVLSMNSVGLDVESIEVDKIRIEHVNSGKMGNWNTDQRIEIYAPIKYK